MWIKKGHISGKMCKDNLKVNPEDLEKPWSLNIQRKLYCVKELRKNKEVINQIQDLYKMQGNSVKQKGWEIQRDLYCTKRDKSDKGS